MIHQDEILPRFKPLRVTLKVRNNVLTRMREELGMNCRQFASAARINYSDYCALESVFFPWASLARARKSCYGSRESHGTPHA